MPYDLLIKNVRVVRPRASSVEDARHRHQRRRSSPRSASNLGEKPRPSTTAKACSPFPGVVDAHMHTGIYSPLAEDAVSESRAAAQGGVTSSLNYFRTGQYYLNKGGPYAEFFPEVLKISAGKFHVDYGFHLAPMDGTHIAEIAESDREARRVVVQDLHVLRLARPARPLRQPARLPDDRARRALRLRALRVRHARRAGGARAPARTRPRRSACRCTARPPRS